MIIKARATHGVDPEQLKLRSDYKWSFNVTTGSWQTVWPDLAIFEDLDHKLAYKRTQIFRILWGICEKLYFFRKPAVDTFWATFGSNWATFYFNIWSPWLADGKGSTNRERHLQKIWLLLMIPARRFVVRFRIMEIRLGILNFNSFQNICQNGYHDDDDIDAYDWQVFHQHLIHRHQRIINKSLLIGRPRSKSNDGKACSDVVKGIFNSSICICTKELRGDRYLRRQWMWHSWQSSRF